MKTSLQLKLGQQLTMTPQLQQAIRLLQLSSLDLQQEIQQAIETNPLLEEDVAEPRQEENDLDNLHLDSSPSSENNDLPHNEETQNPPDSLDIINKQELPRELDIDTTWNEIYSANTASSGIYHDDIPTYQGETKETLTDHLIWQLHLTPFSDTDAAIAEVIIDAIDEKGYLTLSTQEILDSLGSKDIELDEVEAVLKRVQHFDPLGVASRSLQECLLIQLKSLDEQTPFLVTAKLILSEHIDLLANRDFRMLQKIGKWSKSDLHGALELIHRLEPRPGNLIASSEPEYIVPDVSVTKIKNKWVVQINPDSTPKLKINQQYASLIKQECSSEDSQFIRTNLQDAKWLIKSLESRNDTLVKVACCIVEHQQAFFEHGELAMKPMVLNDIALAIDMHESTISRVTTQKYMHTPRGIFELKYFFSSHVATDNGGECSSTAIRALIKQLVADETATKPLSDSKIADLLAKQGIQVARRTIAKYRESLGIAPSNQRKRLM